MKITLADVARASGVSKATASYVLNGKQSSLGLSPVTIHRVMEASRRLNYRPDLLAKALEEQKKNTISVLILSPWLHSQFSDFMVQISHAIESSMKANKCQAEYKSFRSGELKKVLQSSRFKRYDAVIVTGTNLNDDLFLEKNVTKFPNVILLNRYRRGYACACGNDREICEELGIRLGRRNYYSRYILVYGKVLSHREHLRVEGYRKAFGLLPDNAVHEHQYDEEDTQLLSEHLLAQYGSEKSCYIFTQYLNAATLLNTAVRQGMDVPRQVGVIGYDIHTLLDGFLHPQLTTIDPDIYSMTQEALTIARNFKLNQDIQDKVIPATIIEGGSVIL